MREKSWTCPSRGLEADCTSGLEIPSSASSLPTQTSGLPHKDLCKDPGSTWTIQESLSISRFLTPHLQSPFYPAKKHSECSSEDWGVGIFRKLLLSLPQPPSLSQWEQTERQRVVRDRFYLVCYKVKIIDS